MQLGEVQLSERPSRSSAFEFSFGEDSVQVEQRARPACAHRDAAVRSDVRCRCLEALKMQERLDSPPQGHCEQTSVAIFDCSLVGPLEARLALCRVTVRAVNPRGDQQRA